MKWIFLKNIEPIESEIILNILAVCLRGKAKDRKEEQNIWKKIEPPRAAKTLLRAETP